jgi:hypothetical protein
MVEMFQFSQSAMLPIIFIVLSLHPAQRCSAEQGCQIFLGPNIPKREKYNT